MIFDFNVQGLKNTLKLIPLKGLNFFFNLKCLLKHFYRSKGTIEQFLCYEFKPDSSIIKNDYDLDDDSSRFRDISDFPTEFFWHLRNGALPYYTYFIP